MKKAAMAAISLAMTATCVCAQEISPAPATTQSTTAPATQPTTPTVEDPERYLDRLLRAKPGTARPLQPLTPEEASEQKPKAKRKLAVKPDPARPLKRDGDAISDRIGYLEPSEDGKGWQYAFESAQVGMVDPPMVIVPNSRLAAMQDAQERAGEKVRFRVSGLITNYAGQNYFIVESARQWPRIEPATAPATQPGEVAEVSHAGLPTTGPVTMPMAASEPTTLPTTVSATQPVDPEKALAELLRPRPRMARPLEVPAREIAAPPVAEGVAPHIPAAPVRREGEMVVHRAGRLEKGKEGEWSRFVFDADDRGMADPPMIIIPNQRLAQMENALEKSGIDLRFTVTGPIMTYGGRNYLLIEKAQLVTDHEGL